MNYIYHRVPKNLQGNVLFPLNALKDVHPDLYEKEAKKYIGREQIMQQTIPILNCLWNDVLHFSAVLPSQIKQALIDAGATESLDIRFFEIDSHLLTKENTIVYLYKHDSIDDKLKESNFSKYDPDKMAEYSELPQETKDYYKEMLSQGKNPLLFHRVPHILFKGSLDISSIKMV